MINKKIFGFLFIGILVLNYLDAITTYHALSNGISKEYNPNMEYLIQVLGLYNAMLFKIALGILAVFYITFSTVWLYKQYHTCDAKKKKTALAGIKTVLVMCIFLVICMSFVVVGNTFVILGLIKNV